MNGSDQAAALARPARGCGSSEEIDLERVVYDPEYRRWARDHLNRLVRALGGRRGGRGPRKDA